MTAPEFRQLHCTRYRYRYSECRRCADACPHGAVELSGEGAAITAACRECGLCAAACPTEAFATAGRLELLRRVAVKPAVTFACAPSGRDGDETLPCLAALDAASLAFFAARGVAVTLAGAEHCGQCAHGTKGAAMLAQQLDAAAAPRIAFGNEKWGTITLAEARGKAGSDHNAGRRHLFRRLIGRGASGEASSEAPPAPLKAVRFAAPVAVAGRELLQMLFDQPPTKPDPAKTPPPLARHDAIFAARLQASPGCTACEVCARACPTGALEVKESAAAWELTFRQSRCVGCGLCVEACQPGALVFADDLGPVPGAKTPSTLHARVKQRCQRCDRFFISAEPADTCPVCQGDDADFAAIFG